MTTTRTGLPKFTPEVGRRIIDYLRSGAFKVHAANACDVSVWALNNWLRWGEEGKEPYVQFALECQRAIAEDAIRNQMIITRAAAGEHAGDWKAAAWNLERKHPKLYGVMAAGHELPLTERPFSPWKQPDMSKGHDA